jgi:5-methylcytosine-specific restriction endonuclease McrA
VDQHKVRTDPGHARRLVERRDRGVCATCGIDTARVTRILKRLRSRASFRQVLDPQLGWVQVTPTPRDTIRLDWANFALSCWLATGRGRSIRLGHTGSHLWEMDHILPVAEGGGACGLDNLRTLCRPCHRRATGELRRRLNQAK